MNFDSFASDLMPKPIILDSYRNCKRYDGASDKFGITYNGNDYIIKMKKDKYDLSVQTEFIASEIIKGVGVYCHDTMIATYKGEDVIMIKDFTSENVELHRFGDTGESSVDTDINTKEYTYEDIIYLIEKNLKIDWNEKLEIIASFWRMFIMDAILANRDRHSGNWGFIIIDGIKYKFAPLYDNGSSMFPSISKVINEYNEYTLRKEFLRKRVFEFPASQFKVYCKGSTLVKKTNYYDIVEVLLNDNDDFRRVYNSFVPVLNDRLKTSVETAISRIELDDTIKSFYKDIVYSRYKCIILREDFEYTYRKLMGE